MDFTQHNKINKIDSFFPNPNRVIDCRKTTQNYNNAQQYTKNYQPFPTYQQAPQQKLQPSLMQSQYQQQQFHQNINRNPMSQNIGDGGGGYNENRMSTVKCFKPYTFNSPTITNNCLMSSPQQQQQHHQQQQQKNTYFDDSMMIKSHDIDSSQMVSENQILSSSISNESPFWVKHQEPEINMSAHQSHDELSIEYFHMTPPKTAPVKSKKKCETFQPILESMKKFSKNDDIQTALENHQTYFFSHFDDSRDANDTEDEEESDKCKANKSKNVEEITDHQNSFKSRTKIISIPNGVRIITEIVKNDGSGNEVFQNLLPSLKTTVKDKRIKQSKSTTLEDDKNNNDDSNGNNNENENDGDDNEDGDEEYNDSGCYKKKQSYNINL